MDKIPKGLKVAGFKELSFAKKDLDLFITKMKKQNATNKKNN